MPDLKISQLPFIPASALTDVFAVVPSGSATTYKVSLESIKNFIVPYVQNAIGFPNQAGQGGKFLQTDGAVATWQPIPIPTIQQVINAGNISNNQALFFNGAPNGEDIALIGNDGFVGNKSILVARNTTLPIGVQHYFMNDRERYDNNNKTLTLSPHPLDNWYDLKYPKSNGTLATKVNGVSADSSGNIVLPQSGSQNLQQTLSIGNTATIGIVVNSPVTSDQTFNGLRVFDSDVNFLYVRPSSIYADLEEGETTLQFVNITGGAITLNTPQANGTLALSVNSVPTDAQGNILLDIDDIGVPTLEQVTTAGNITDNEIFVVDNISNPTREAAILKNIGSFRSKNLQNNRLGSFTFEGAIWLTEFGGFNSIQHYNTIGVSSLYIPDNVGTRTIPVSVNGVFANGSGNISIPTGTNIGLQSVLLNDPYTDQDIFFIDGGAINDVDTISFDLTPVDTTHQEGRVRWNDTLKTLSIDTENSGVKINVGHETIQRVRNVSGSTILKGKIVYINGESGATPTIALSSNTSDATSAQTIGWVLTDINNNQFGYVITNGLLENISTIGLAPGTQLYLGTSGNYTTTFPTQPLHNVRVGIVINGNSVNGSIFINILNGYELEELHDVLITSPQNDEVLTYETSSGLWKNKQLTAPAPTLKTIEGQSLLGTGNIDLNKSDVGLSNVDNTSDANKPVSTATQTALNAKQDTLVSGTNIRTIAGNSLVGSGNVTLDQILPSQTGQAGKVLKTNGTNASWDIDFTGAGGTSDGYCLHLGYAAWSPPTAGNTWTTGWFYGQNPDTLFNDRPSRRFIIPKTGIVKSVTILTALGGVGSGGTQTLTIQLQNITTGLTSTIITGYSIASGSLISLSRQDIFSGLSIPVSAGDVCHMRIVMPTFTTAPTGLSQIFNLFVEQ